MKRSICLVLIFSYLTAAFQFTMPYLSYMANYSYFATEACVNKLNPEMECNGKCQLKKMVEEQHNQYQSEEQGFLVKKVSSSTIFFCPKIQQWNIVNSASHFLRLQSDTEKTLIFSEPSSPPPRLG